MEYNHFLVLFVATRICSCNKYKGYLPIAAKLFRIYVEKYIEIYGRHSISSNVHNLIHVTEDLQHAGAGNLMDISTYKFENTLRLLGLKLKHSNRPLEQIVCRYIEQNKPKNPKMQFNAEQHVDNSQPKVFYEKRRDSRSTFQKINISPSFMLSNRKDKDSWFMTKSKDIVKFEYAIKDKLNYKVFGLRIAHEQKIPFFTNPVNSTKLDIYASSKKFENDLQAYSLETIETKMMCLIHEDQFVFIPLLHTLDNDSS